MPRKKKEVAETTDSAEETASPAGDVGMRTLRAGTTVFLLGSDTPLMLEGDVSVSGPRVDRDSHFVGMLRGDAVNWDLNIDQVEGVWSPVTGQRQPDEPVETEE